MRRCGVRVDCYVAAITEPAAKELERPVVALKAVTMVGVLGQPEHKQAVLDKLDEITHPDVAARAGEVIAHLSPSRDAATEAALEARIKGEQNPAVAIAFERALHRVRAR